MLIVCTLDNDMMKIVLYVCDFCPQNSTHKFYHVKNVRQIPTERYFAKYFFQGHPKQGKSEKLSQPRGT